MMTMKIGMGLQIYNLRAWVCELRINKMGSGTNVDPHVMVTVRVRI